MKPPQVPCSGCVSKGENISDVLVICYCEHNQSLGLYYIESQKWHVFSPMSKEEFYFYLEKSTGQATEFSDKALDKVFELIPGKEI
jgi:hypothetical protein